MKPDPDSTGRQEKQDLPDMAPARAWRLDAPQVTRFWSAVSIGLSIIGLALLTSLIPARYAQTQMILHHLNFIPLVLSGALFGWRGAATAGVLAGVIHLPHLFNMFPRRPVMAVDSAVELAIFCIAGVITGFLAERERGQRRSLEGTKRELETVYEELRRNVEQLKKAERLSAAGRLSAGLAHEIRNPLASIAGAAGILRRRHASGEDYRECLDIIDIESQRLNKLLTNFLEFARPRTPRFQQTDVTAVIDSVLVLATHMMPVNSIELRKEVDPELPELDCDAEQLKQVLLNLVINAVQATKGEGIVRVRAWTHDARIAISVSDEGCGIPPEERDRIFEPFFTTKDDGTGLGLAVASRIIDQHGGELVAEDNPDRGTTLRIELPLRRNQPV